MFEYLAGCGILVLLCAPIYYFREDLRLPMWWSGLFYVAYSSVQFVVWKLLSIRFDVATAINPHYWTPDTLFNLSAKTGGYAIEDALFMLFAGALAAGVYEVGLYEKVSPEQRRDKHVQAILCAFVSFLVLLFIPEGWNLIYPLIVSNFIGAVFLCIDRPDLTEHAVCGGAVFVVIYFCAFYLFNQLFPQFIDQAYNLHNLTGVLLLGVPLEEVLYALSFGLFWAPLYEYEHGYVDVEMA